MIISCDSQTQLIDLMFQQEFKDEFSKIVRHRYLDFV